MRRIVVAVYLGCIGTVLFSARAEIPQLISYQGRVTDSGGDPVPDGSYTMRFMIYDAASGGNVEWDSGDRMVDVSDGVFTVRLGESPQPAVDLSFDEDYWLGVSIGGDIQSPRTPFGSVSYAYMASGVVAGTEVTGAVTTGTYAAFKATNTSESFLSYGLYGGTASTEGRGVAGYASSSAGTTYGVFGLSVSPGGRGVHGEVWGTTGSNRAVSGVTYSSSGTAVYGEALAATGIAYGVYGLTSSSSGYGVFGMATATSGFAYGGQFQSAASNGRGVFGWATATSGPTVGGQFWAASPAGIAVQGYASATAGATVGVVGASASPTGTGIYGEVYPATGLNYGVHGKTSSASGTGVYGEALAATGTTYGVYGLSNSTSGYGVFGKAAASSGFAYGGQFQSAASNGRGVFGWATATSGPTVGGQFWAASPAGIAVQGYESAPTGDTYGGYFSSVSPDGFGVYGEALATNGVWNGGVMGKTASSVGAGVVGEGGNGGRFTGTSAGVLAETYDTSSLSYGVFGRAGASTGNAVGILGESWPAQGSGIGVYGRTWSTDGRGVYYSGGLAGTGSKSCVVKTSRGPTMFYCQESPENWFEDFGGGQLVQGRAHVELDHLFLEAVTIDDENPLRVFVQLHDEASRRVVVRKGLTGFDVIEVEGGRSNGTFDYRVVAKRRGFETHRLEVCESAREDPYLYPEYREQHTRARMAPRTETAAPPSH